MRQLVSYETDGGGIRVEQFFTDPEAKDALSYIVIKQRHQEPVTIYSSNIKELRDILSRIIGDNPEVTA